MSYPYLLCLKPSVVYEEQEDSSLFSGLSGNALRLINPSPGIKRLVSLLLTGDITADALCEAATLQEPGIDLARIYYILTSLQKKTLLNFKLVIDNEIWVTLEPTSPAFFLIRTSDEATHRLSRFACLRRQDKHMMVESALGHGRVVLHNSHAVSVVSYLAMSHSATELANLINIDVNFVRALLGMLCSAGLVFTSALDGKLPEDNDPVLQSWEFHDIQFHSRSRMGRHTEPCGATSRFSGTLAHPPVVKPPMSKRRVALYQPDMAALAIRDKPFSFISEARRSIRQPGEDPLSAQELGEFLYRSARVKRIVASTPTHEGAYEYSSRVCASGGSMHDLELYLTIWRCEGIEPGFYHYNPLDHVLEHLSGIGPEQRALLADSCGAAAQQATDVLITLTSRFQRTQWKYQSIAYALILKNVGVLYHQMYLVATAMELAPCALGSGNSDRFAKAAGLDYFAETSVGEFLLSRQDKLVGAVKLPA